MIEVLSAQLPSNPKTREGIFDAIKEIGVAMASMDAQRAQIADIKEYAKDEYGIAPALLGKLATAYHKQSFQKEVGVAEEFQEFYTAIVEAGHKA